MTDFEYAEDRQYFIDLLASGDANRFEREFRDRFDFRPPAVKRREFNVLRKKLYPVLFKKYHGHCQLRIHPDCSKVKKFDVDHIIPLSTNVLNKQLRHLKAKPGRKVRTQSFGSNSPRNLILACSRCNQYKKHRLI